MNLPHLNKGRPTLDDTEHFFYVVGSMDDEIKRVLNALAVAGSFEATAQLANVVMGALPTIIASLLKLKPRQELLAFDGRSLSFVFIKAGDGEVYACVLDFASEFATWLHDTDVMRAMKNAEEHHDLMRQTRRGAA